MADGRNLYFEGAIPFFFEVIDVGAGAVGLSASQMATKDFVGAEVELDNGPTVYTYDGSTPVAPNTGKIGYQLDNIYLTVARAIRFLAVRQGAVNGTLRVHYFLKR